MKNTFKLSREQLAELGVNTKEELQKLNIIFDGFAAVEANDPFLEDCVSDEVKRYVELKFGKKEEKQNAPGDAKDDSVSADVKFYINNKLKNR